MERQDHQLETDRHGYQLARCAAVTERKLMRWVDDLRS